MNPLTNMKNVLKLSEQELKRESKTSWHDMYKDSAWIFIGGLPYDLTEGDIIAVFSQYGEIVNINLVRDRKTGKQKGFCFICYEDQRSTILAVDNFNGIKILGRTIRVDHVADYKAPKDDDKTDEETRRLYIEGCAPKLQIPAEGIKKEPATPSFGDDDRNLRIRESIKTEPGGKKAKVKKEKRKKEKKTKKAKKEKKSKKKKRRHSSSSSNDSSDDPESSKESESKKRKSKKSKRKRSRSR